MMTSPLFWSRLVSKLCTRPYYMYIWKRQLQVQALKIVMHSCFSSKNSSSKWNSFRYNNRQWNNINWDSKPKVSRYQQCYFCLSRVNCVYIFMISWFFLFNVWSSVYHIPNPYYFYWYCDLLSNNGKLI